VGNFLCDRTAPDLWTSRRSAELLLVAFLFVEPRKSIIEIVIYTGCRAFRRATKTPAAFSLIVCARDRRRLIVGHDRALITSHENAELPGANAACETSAKISPRFVTIPAFNSLAEQEFARDSNMKPVEIRG
jgi:hypothetical protein